MPRRKNASPKIPLPPPPPFLDTDHPLIPLNSHLPTPSSLTSQVAKLPEVCQHLIYKQLHKMYMKDLCREIIHNVVWIRLRSGNNYRYQFLTSTQKNFTVWNENE